MTPAGFGTVLLLTSTEVSTDLGYALVRVNSIKARAILEARRDFFRKRCLEMSLEVEAAVVRIIRLGYRNPVMIDGINMTLTFESYRNMLSTLKDDITDRIPKLPDTGIWDDFDKWAGEINRYDEEMSSRVKGTSEGVLRSGQKIPVAK